MSYVSLDRAVFSVSGPDARSFLQGLVTVDVLKLAADVPRYAALLSPQGKYLHDFFLIADGERIVVDAEKARVNDLMGRLKLYRLRANVDIQVLPEVQVFAVDDVQAGGMWCFTDPRHAGLGARYYAKMPPAGEALPFSVYDTKRLELGIPDGSRDLVPERSLLLECGFDALHGVDFDKGCYVGQEVTARSKFRAQLRKHFYMVQGAQAVPHTGAKLMHGDIEVGEMRSSCGALGLALLNNDLAQKAEFRLSAEEHWLSAQLPPWGVQATGAGEITG